LYLLDVKESCTGATIYEKIWDYLFSGSDGEKRQKQVIGIVCDGATNMISSCGAGAANRLQGNLEHIIVTHDFCHCLNLIIKHATETFPTEPTRLVEQICQSFAKSALKTAQFRCLIEDLQ